MSVERRRSDIDWNDVVKKEARGINDEDLGEVQEIGIDYIFVQKGLINKENFYIPYTEVDSYDGNVLKFKLSEEVIRSNYAGDPSNSSPNVSIVKHDIIDEKNRSESEFESTTTISLPLAAEKLSISKTDVVYKEAKIIKDPIAETKEIEVPLFHEEIAFERRSVEKTAASIERSEPPVTSRQEIKIPLKREEAELKKETYVKEEIIVKKKRVVETKTVTEEVKSEELLDSSQR